MSNDKKYRLPKEFGEKWLKALRSDEYKQVSGTLYNAATQGYCCLGVACRIEYPLHYLKNSKGDSFGLTINKGTGSDDLKYELHKIPEELKGNSHDNKLVGELTEMNDNDEKSFKDIANWIEENVEFYSDNKIEMSKIKDKEFDITEVYREGTGVDKKFLKQYKVDNRIITLCIGKFNTDEYLKEHSKKIKEKFFFILNTSLNKHYIDQFYKNNYTIGYSVRNPEDKITEEIGNRISIGRQNKNFKTLFTLNDEMKLNSHLAESFLDTCFYNFKRTILEDIIKRESKKKQNLLTDGKKSW